MKNKILFFGSLCLVLALGLVMSGCEQTVDAKLPEVALKLERVVGELPAKDSKSPVFIVSFKAVEGAVKYKVFTQTQNDSASVFDVNEFTDAIVTAGTNSIQLIDSVKYSATSIPAELDADKDTATKSDYAVVVDFVDVNEAIQTLGLGRIGIMAIPLLTDKEPSLTWTEYVDFDLEWDEYTTN